VNYFEMIDETIEFIEDNLQNDISLDTLAERYYCSKFHFHRIFQSFAGKPVIQYVRERKMEYSTSQLLNSKKKIGDIAFEIGFNSHAAFTRLFKTYYGITPDECRKYDVCISKFAKAKISKEKIIQSRPNFLSSPEIVELDQFEVIGIETRSTYDENLKNNTIPETCVQKE